MTTNLVTAKAHQHGPSPHDYIINISYNNPAEQHDAQIFKPRLEATDGPQQLSRIQAEDQRRQRSNDQRRR